MQTLSVAIALLLAACVTSTGWPTGYSREAPAGVYPAGDLSGPPTWFLGWKWRL